MNKMNFTFLKRFQSSITPTFCFLFFFAFNINFVEAQCVPQTVADLVLDESGITDSEFQENELLTTGSVTLPNSGDPVTDVEIGPPIMLSPVDDYVPLVDYAACIDAAAGTATLDFNAAGSYLVRVVRMSGAEDYLNFDVVSGWHSTCYERGRPQEFDCPAPAKGFSSKDIVDSIYVKLGIPAGFDSVVVTGVNDLVTKVCTEAGTGTIPLVIDAHGCSGNIFINGESISCDAVDSTRLKKFLELKGKVSSVTLLSCSVGYGARGKAFLKKLSKELCVPVTGNTATITSWVRNGSLKWGSYGGKNITVDYKDLVKTKTKDGLNVTSFGDATLVLEPSDELVVSNIGSSGQDGVAIDLGGEDGAGASQFKMVTDFNPTNFPSGTNFNLVAVGSINGLSAEWVHVNFSKPGPSSSMDIEFFVPHTDPLIPWVPLEFEIVVKTTGCIEASIPLPDATNPITMIMDAVASTDIFQLVWNGNWVDGILDPLSVFSMTFDPRAITLPGLGPIVGDELELRFLLPPSTTGLDLMTQSLVLENRSGFTTTSNNFLGGPTFNILEQQLMIPGKQMWWEGLGGAVIAPQINPQPAPGSGELVVSNIGSSGLDGVSMINDPTRPTSSMGFCALPLEPYVDGASVNFIPFGLINGQPDPGGLGTVSYQLFGGNFLYFVDFFPLNSFLFNIDILLGGNPVGNIPPVPDFFNIGQGNNPFECAYFAIDENGNLIYDLRFPPGTNLNLLGFNGQADQLIITPINPMPVDFLVDLNMQGFNSPESFLINGFLCDPFSLPMDIKVFQQGFFNGTDMSSAIPTLPDFPLAMGDDVIQDPGSILPNIVDWVKVKFRDKNNFLIVKEVNALLGNDGTILGMDGMPLRVGLPLGRYYVSICHRNHLEIMTPNFIPYVNPTVPPPVDLCNSQSFMNGSIPENGFFVAPAGDFNGDGAINAVDKNTQWAPQNGQPSSYDNTADGNGDGTVNAVDKNSEWAPNNGIQTQVPDGN